MAWIQTIEPEQAEGKLSDIYAKIASARSGVASIHRAQSLNPRAMVAHLVRIPLDLGSQSGLI